jgi:hypothetical protein
MIGLSFLAGPIATEIATEIELGLQRSFLRGFNFKD